MNITLLNSVITLLFLPVMSILSLEERVSVCALLVFNFLSGFISIEKCYYYYTSNSLNVWIEENKNFLKILKTSMFLAASLILGLVAALVAKVFDAPGMTVNHIFLGSIMICSAFFLLMDAVVLGTEYPEYIRKQEEKWKERKHLIR